MAQLAQPASLLNTFSVPDDAGAEEMIPFAAAALVQALDVAGADLKRGDRRLPRPRSRFAEAPHNVMFSGETTGLRIT
jgi:hypothetical protein